MILALIWTATAFGVGCSAPRMGLSGLGGFCSGTACLMDMLLSTPQEMTMRQAFSNRYCSVLPVPHRRTEKSSLLKHLETVFLITKCHMSVSFLPGDQQWSILGSHYRGGIPAFWGEGRLHEPGPQIYEHCPPPQRPLCRGEDCGACWEAANPQQEQIKSKTQQKRPSLPAPPVTLCPPETLVISIHPVTPNQLFAYSCKKLFCELFRITWISSLIIYFRGAKQYVNMQLYLNCC